MTQGWPAGLISALWLLWAIYWLISAQSVKPTRQRESLNTRLTFLVLMLLAAMLLLTGHRRLPLLEARWIGGGWMRYWIAVALVVAGLSFSVWARRTLGGNWSGTVTVKVNHEPVQTGPYRRIRHPIYTGLLLAVFGSGLAAGRLYGMAAFLFVALALWWRLRVEERWMRVEFGDHYEAYRRTSWALMPYVYWRDRVHDLKHTFGRRLRAAGVSFEDRQDLLGHKSGRITTHYPQAELTSLIEAADKVCSTESGQSPATTWLRRWIG